MPPTPKAAGEGRRYGGADADERRLRRRAAFIEAGQQLFGEQGYAQVSVKALCDEAGFTQRYFYESFPDRAALLIAVYVDCVGRVRTATLDAADPFIAAGAVAPDEVPAAARAALGAFMDSLVGNPPRARVMLVEVVGVNPEIERVRQRAIHGWADLILFLARGGRTPTRAQRLAAIGLVGAITQLMVDWYVTAHAPSDGADPGVGLGADPGFDPDAILDVGVDLFVAAYDRLLA